jgi:hypothetical protein
VLLLVLLLLLRPFHFLFQILFLLQVQLDHRLDECTCSLVDDGGAMLVRIQGPDCVSGATSADIDGANPDVRIAEGDGLELDTVRQYWYGKSTCLSGSRVLLVLMWHILFQGHSLRQGRNLVVGLFCTALPQHRRRA